MPAIANALSLVSGLLLLVGNSLLSRRRSISVPSGLLLHGNSGGVFRTDLCIARPRNWFTLFAEEEDWKIDR